MYTIKMFLHQNTICKEFITNPTKSDEVFASSNSHIVFPMRGLYVTDQDLFPLAHKLLVTHPTLHAHQQLPVRQPDALPDAAGLVDLVSDFYVTFHIQI